MDPATMAMLAMNLVSMLNPGGKDEKYGSTYTRGQQNLINNGASQLQGGMPDINQNPQYQQQNDWLMSMFNDPDFFKNFEAPLQRQFQEETIPGVANRFASMGSGGALGSTAFRNQLGRESSNLSTNIASLRGGMQQNAIGQLQNSAQMPGNNYLQMIQSILGHQPNNTYQGASNPTAPIAGAATQGWMQSFGM